MTSRSIAQAAHERFNAFVMEIDADYCNNTFGVSPCTASGTPCYNTYSNCAAKAAYVKGVKTYKFCLRGMTIPPGETVRPYVTAHSFTPTEIQIGGGLGTRSQTTLTLADETCSDFECDPYAATRPSPAGGTYWTRWLARNYNAAGRPVRIRKGYVVRPWDWATFQTELYQLVSIAQDASGNMQVVLTDPIKPLDQNMLPVPTDGKLQVDFKAVENIGYAAAGATSTITLSTAASAIDGAYVGMECYLTQNTGSGQRRVISAYVGATRVATLSVAWLVIPDTTSVYEISPLSINVGSGKGAQYSDPVATGLPQFVRIGDELIQYTALAGDVLSWASSTSRAQFGTVRQDSAVGDGVQLCFAPVNQSITSVIHRLINSAGVADAYIDLTGLAQEDADWYDASVLITTCISTPEKSSSLLCELLIDLGMNSWWDAVAQKQRFKADMPQLSSAVSITPDESIQKTMKITPLDSLRITRSYQAFAPYSATSNMSESKNFSITDGYIDAGAESPQEYNGSISQIKYSRWLTAQNQLFVLSLVARRINRLRDAPFKASFSLDPRDEINLGDLIDLTTRRKTDISGNPIAVRMRVTKYLDNKNFDIEAISTNFSVRYAFIAPDGTPDYPTDTTYAHISQDNGLMSDNTQGFLII